ncbi:MAG: undecaprenyl-diphosphatase UppP [Patescibacteria group bacterium]
MQYFLAIFAGVLQGLTEFLPISSSGHLVIFHQIFKVSFIGGPGAGESLSGDLLFDVVLHLGTLVALLVFFFRDVEKIVRGFFSSLTNWNWANNFNQRLAWLVIIGTIPAAILGFFLEDLITNYSRSAFLVAIMLIVVAVLFWIFEKYSLKQKDLQTASRWDSLIIGCAQALALIPGVSRSGITIIAGLGRKMKRIEAARFSFLLSMPIIFAAGIKKILEIDSLANVNWLILIIGFLTATVSGYLVIKYFLKYLNRHSLNIFAWYRLIIGCLILIWLIFFFGA